MSEIRTIGDMIAAHGAATAEAFDALADAWPGPLAWARRPVVHDGHGTVTVGWWGGYWLQIARLAFTDRILLTPQRHPTGVLPGDGSWDHGWCYPAGSGQATVALLTWNPATEGEPGLYVKRASHGLRRAGETARGWSPDGWIDYRTGKVATELLGTEYTGSPADVDG